MASIGELVAGADASSLRALVLALSERFGQDAADVVRSSLAPRATTAAPSAAAVVATAAAAPPPKKEKRAFDMSRYRQHHVAMEFQYDGGAYFGFASQAAGDCEETVEKHIFEALLKCRLIESRQTCGYSRCGRTDRGVSALGQVIALNLRSSLPKTMALEDSPRHICDVYSGESKAVPSSSSSSPPPPPQPPVAEMDYVGMLNRCLPESIRCTGWVPVTPDFSARFSCASRTYRYFFVRKKLDVEAMARAAALLIGEHDFRHICKMDMANITNFRRIIYSAQISPFSNVGSAGLGEEDTVWMLEIRGIAFLWHMVRCIMALLFLVGERREQPEIVSELLDVAKLPGKPQYCMAAEDPLVLHQCGFDRLSIQRSPRALFELTLHFEKLWETAVIAACRARNAVQFLASCSVREQDVLAYGVEKSRRKGGSAAAAAAAAVAVAGESEGASPPGGSRKRPKLEVVAKSTGPPSVSFAEALRILNDQFGIAYPYASTSGEFTAGYVPLLQRKLSETYQDKKDHLGGTRKERLERHLQMDQDDKDPSFHERMRKEGNLF